jgi:hypothetical protein
MKINLQITYLDKNEKKDVVAVAADLVAFETKFNLSVASLQSETKLTHLFFLAYSVERRTGAIKDQSFEQWLETIETVEAGEAKK